MTAPTLTPLLATGTKKSHRRGQKIKQHPHEDNGGEERDQRTLNPSPKAHITGKGDREEKYNLCLGQREEEKPTPDDQGNKRKRKRKERKPKKNNHSHIQPLLEIAQREG